MVRYDDVRAVNSSEMVRDGSCLDIVSPAEYTVLKVSTLNIQLAGNVNLETAALCLKGMNYHNTILSKVLDMILHRQEMAQLEEWHCL